MQLENLVIGQNIAKFRKLKDLKASDVANQLGIKEATYTKYERGETAITIDFLQRVAELLNIDPMHLLAANPTNFLESITNSSFSIQNYGNNICHNFNEQQNTTMLKLMESMMALNEKLSLLLEKRSDKI